jgi:hypothetical protein
MFRLATALSLSGGLAAATVIACGGRPGSPAEAPPLAPRPDPAGPGAQPLPANPDPTLTPDDAGPALSPGPVSSVPTVRAVPSPQFAPDTGAAAQDAGVSDSYEPPLPPIPDGGVPIDSRLEPR